MQEKKLIFKKLVALMVTFLLMMLECMPILTNISLAAEDYENSVEVKGYFSGENIENTSSLDCNADNNSITLNFDVNVKNKGYFKSGTLKFEDNLNFSVKEDSEVKLKDNQIKLQVLNQNETQTITIPIEFKREDTLKASDISKVNKVTFNGAFVDNEGNEHKIEKQLELKLSWKETISTKIDYTILKNIDYEKDGENGKILQLNVKTSGADKNNNLPIKNSKIKIDIPEIPGMEFDDAKVEANKNSYTQGREDYEIDASNISSSINEKVLEINVLNKEQDGKIYNSFGEDSFTVTFLYKGVKEGEDVVTNNINVEIENYAGNKEEQSIEVVYDLSKPVGNVVQYTREDKEDSISNGYLMANTDEEKYSITYTKKDVINISRADLISGLEIMDKDEYFVDSDSNAYSTDTPDVLISTYKSTEFSRDNLVNILGEEGKVSILNMNDEVISEITFDKETDENGNYIVSYEEAISKIKILTTSPITDGNITFLSTKAIKKVNYNRSFVKEFTALVNVSQGFATYNEGAIDDLGEVSSEITINETTSAATVEMAQTEFPTTVTSEGVNLKVRLNNSEETSDLYENPVFEIRLPQAIKNVTIKNTDLFYANGELEIANVETLIDGDNKVIRVTLAGTQKSYNLNKETNGTIISIDMDLEIDEFTGNISEMVEMYYYNVVSKKYSNESEWHMLSGAGNVSYEMNGYDGVQISYKAPEELVNGQTSETKDENTENEDKGKVSSVKQGAETNLVEEGTEAKLATMDITVLNNTDKSYSNFKILGRIPFTGNKDVTTGEDLGTTVDTILDTEISSSNPDLPYAVYYSENGEATADLYDENNGWRTDFYKMGAIKSYLILLNSDYVLAPKTKLQFSYDYVIPANLKAGDAFYGTYATYYEETSTNVSSNSSANKIGYETAKEANIEASMKLNTDTIRELSDAEFEITLKNTSDVDAENVNMSFPLISGLVATLVKCDDDVTAQVDENTVTVHMDKLKKNSETKIVVCCGTFKLQTSEETLKVQLVGSADNVEGFSAETPEYNVEKTNFNIAESGIYDSKFEGDVTNCILNVSNQSLDDMKNVHITKQLSKDIIVNNIVVDQDDVSVTYDQNTGLLDIYVPEMAVGEGILVYYDMCLKIGVGNGSKYEIDSKTVCTCDDSSKNIEYTNKIEFGLLNLSIDLVNKKDLGYLKDGESKEYIYKVTNLTDIDLFPLSMYLETSNNMDVDILNISGDSLDYGTMNGANFDTATTISLSAGQSIMVRVNVTPLNTGDNFCYAMLRIANGEKIAESEKYYSLIDEDNENQNSFKITGCVYMDENKNQQLDNNENALSGTIVNLYNSETNDFVDSKITDISGRYLFTGLENGKYYIKFDYDDTKYNVSTNADNSIGQVASMVMNVNDNCVTDNIEITNGSISSVDLPLSKDERFDLKLDATVTKMTVQNKAENNEFLAENPLLAKVDIDPNLLDGSKVFIEYKVTVENQGNIPGRVNKIIDYMSDDLEFDSSINSDWYKDSEGNLYTTALENEVIQPNESKELTLILYKNVTEENTGLIHNTFEIADAINDKGIEDIDSVPGNKLQEDDLSYADSIIGVATGMPISVIPIIIVIIIILIPVAFLVWKKIDERRYV